jgi:hypothetical protein
VATGVLTGVISHTGTPLAYNSIKAIESDIIKFLWEGGNMMTKYDEPIEGDIAMETVFQTVLCGHHTTKSLAEQNRLRQSMQALFGHYIFLASGGSPGASEWYPHTREFIQRCMDAAAGRKWCVTDWGLFGIVSGRAENGDHIAMIDNCPLPFIFRPHSEDKDTEYSLVGHGYFHDLKKQVDSFSSTLEHQKIIIE